MMDRNEALKALKDHLSAMTEDEKQAFLKEAGFVYQEKKAKRQKPTRSDLIRNAASRRRGSAVLSHGKRKTVKPAYNR